MKNQNGTTRNNKSLLEKIVKKGTVGERITIIVRRFTCKNTHYTECITLLKNVQVIIGVTLYLLSVYYIILLGDKNKVTKL